MLRVAVLVTLFISIAGNFAHAQSSLTERDYEVILSIIGNNEFVIKEKTGSDPWSTVNWKYISQTFKQIDRATFDNFVETNKEPARIERKFSTEKKYTIISDAELKSYFRAPGNLRQEWDDFKKAYPGSGGYYYEVSRPGFDRQGVQALIFVSFYCGSLCADGSWYFLELVEGKWKLIQRKGVWAS